MTSEAKAMRLSVEIAAKALARQQEVTARLPQGTEVFVPFLPGQDIETSAETSRLLARAGLVPVPHLPVRAIADRAELGDALARLAAAGADSLLLIAGDRKRPAGAFADTLAVLDTGLIEASGLRRLNVAGHPTGHPMADDDALMSALRTKAAFGHATGIDVTIVTQFVFEAEPVIQWLGALRDGGIDLPVRIGVSGPARLRTLLAFALQCGVAAAAEATFTRPMAVAKLMGHWTADTVVADLAAYREESGDRRLAGVHVYSFGGVDYAVDWLNSLDAAGVGQNREGRMAGSA